MRFPQELKGGGNVGIAGSTVAQRQFYVIRKQEEIAMSVEGKAKEVAGFVKEEFYEHGKTPEDKKKAQEGRDLRNEGRIEDGKAPKTTPPGTGN